MQGEKKDNTKKRHGNKSKTKRKVDVRWTTQQHTIKQGRIYC